MADIVSGIVRFTPGPWQYPITDYIDDISYSDMADEYNDSMDKMREFKNLINWFILKYPGFLNNELYEDLSYRKDQMELINDGAFELCFDYEQHYMAALYL